MSPAPSRSLLRPEVVRSLTAVRSRTDRVRARATTAAATGTGVALLVAGAVATVHDTVVVGSSSYTGADGVQVTEDLLEAPGDLAPFLAQPGLRPGVIVAAVLLVLPFLALAVQALRVGRVVEQRRARQLLVAGATWRDLRRLRVARTTAAFVRGGLLAGPVYLLLWLLLGLALPAGARLLPPLAWSMPLVWLAAVGLSWGTGLLLAVLGTRVERDAALQRAGETPPVPSRSFVLLTAAAGTAVVFSTPFSAEVPALFPVALVLAVVLLLVAAGAASARAAVSSATRPARRVTPGPGRLLRGRDVAVGLLADAQRRGSAVAVAGTAGVLFVCGLSFGVESGLAAQALAPRDEVSGYASSDLAFYVGGAALAGAVGLVAAVVAVAALLLSLTDQLLGNRRAVASTAALGVETRRLVAVQARCLTRTAVPVTVLGVLVPALPSALALIVDVAPRWSWSSLLPLAVAVVAGALIALACRLLALALTGRVRAAAALENLRVA